MFAGEQPPGVRITRLGDAAPRDSIVAGVLRGHQSQVTHQLARVLEAAQSSPCALKVRWNDPAASAAQGLIGDVTRGTWTAALDPW